MYVVFITPNEERSNVLMGHDNYASMSTKSNFLVVY